MGNSGNAVISDRALQLRSGSGLTFPNQFGIMTIASRLTPRCSAVALDAAAGTSAKISATAVMMRVASVRGKHQHQTALPCCCVRELESNAARRVGTIAARVNARVRLRLRCVDGDERRHLSRTLDDGITLASLGAEMRPSGRFVDAADVDDVGASAIIARVSRADQ